MMDLQEKLRKLKNNDTVVEQVRMEVQNIPQVDHDRITGALQTALMSLFNTQNAIDEQRKGKILEELEEYGEKTESLVKMQERVLAEISKATGAIQGAIKAIKIPKTDLSGLSAQIRGIKPTDVSDLVARIERLEQSIQAIPKPEKQKPVNLKPVLEAIKEPKTKTVTFEVETDQWDFPVKVIAKESYK